ncbi:MAG: hypothetical protein HC802_02750 [Caldilineaceae bacterium]|nr:hypothetical protein [Caldilineaceae bacterium]
MTPATPSQQETDSSSRLATIRRLYFYLVALVSLLVAFASFAGLLDILTSVWLGERGLVDVNTVDYVRNSVARSAGLLLVSTPLFLIHWGYMQRRQAEAGESRAAVRKFFLYTASAAALIPTLQSIYALLDGIIQSALGEPLATNDLWPSAWLYHLLLACAGIGLVGYFQSVLRSDGDLGHEDGWSGVFRRLYLAGIGLAALLMLLFGATGVLESSWQFLFDSFSGPATVGWWRVSLSNGLTLVLIGAFVRHYHWRRWSQIFDQNPDEARTGLRRLYLYAGVLIGALATLIPAASLLSETLLWLFGASTLPMSEVLDGLATPLAYIPVGIAIWFGYSRILSSEASRFDDSRESALVDRIYNYTVTATGLALLWLGAVDLLQAILDWLFVATNIVGAAASSSGRVWAQPLANGLSLLAIGAPVWSLHWRTVQLRATDSGEEGLAERASGPRKAYLYGVAFVAALLILAFLAQVIYRLLLVALGDPNAQVFSPETVAEAARSLIAVVVLFIHARAIRQDARLGVRLPEVEKRPGEDEIAQARQRIEELEGELAAARLALGQLEAATKSVEEMSAAEAPPSQAH